MSTGLRVPVGVNRAGGANIETDEVEQTKKLLMLALSEGGDHNPFQDIGLKGDLVFSIRNASFRGRAQKSIERILIKFGDRIRLAPGEPINFNTEIENEVEVSFTYIDLSTNKEEDFQMKFVR